MFLKHLQNNKLCFSNKVANQVDARFERHPFSSETHPAMRGSVIRDDRQLGITGEHTHTACERAGFTGYHTRVTGPFRLAGGVAHLKWIARFFFVPCLVFIFQKMEGALIWRDILC